MHYWDQTSLAPQLLGVANLLTDEFVHIREYFHDENINTIKYLLKSFKFPEVITSDGPIYSNHF